MITLSLLKKYAKSVPTWLNIFMVLLCVNTTLKIINNIVEAEYSSRIAFIKKDENGFSVFEIAGEKNSPPVEKRLSLASLGVDTDGTKHIMYQRKIGDLFGWGYFCGLKFSSNPNTKETKSGVVCTINF